MRKISFIALLVFILSRNPLCDSYFIVGCEPSGLVATRILSGEVNGKSKRRKKF